jgi:tripartite-type tricarboxylate transporter receptor subunit TctC
MQRRFHVYTTIALAAFSFAWAPAACASEQWPTKTVRLVVPFPPGGATDIVGRLIADELGRDLKQSIIIDNKPGASGAIGMNDVSRSPADGYTFAVVTDSIPLQELLNPKISWSLSDFRGVTKIATSPEALVVHPSLPAKTVKEFVALAKADPNKYSYAASGTGSIHHLAGEVFKKTSSAPLTHVPYKGGGQSIVDLVAGRVHAAFIGIAPVLNQVNNGTLRVLAVTGDVRSEVLPSVPTFAEAGFADFQVQLWIGVLARKETPPEIVDRMQQAIARVLTNPETFKRLATLGFSPVGDRPQKFDPWLREEQANWGVAIKELGLAGN